MRQKELLSISSRPTSHEYLNVKCLSGTANVQVDSGRSLNKPTQL